MDSSFPFLGTKPDLRAKCREFSEIINSGTQPLQGLGVLRALPHEMREKWAQQWIERGLQGNHTVHECFVSDTFDEINDICLVIEKTSIPEESRWSKGEVHNWERFYHGRLLLDPAVGKCSKVSRKVLYSLFSLSLSFFFLVVIFVFVLGSRRRKVDVQQFPELLRIEEAVLSLRELKPAHPEQQPDFPKES